MSAPKKYADCLFDFRARQADELSFRKGDTIEIVDDSEIGSDWWLARDANLKEGYIPKTFVQTYSQKHSLRKSVSRHESPRSELIPITTKLKTTSSPRLRSPMGDWAFAVDTESGDVYYFNTKTGQSQWEPPTITEISPLQKSTPYAYLSPASPIEIKQLKEKFTKSPRHIRDPNIDQRSHEIGAASKHSSDELDDLKKMRQKAEAKLGNLRNALLQTESHSDKKKESEEFNPIAVDKIEIDASRLHSKMYSSESKKSVHTIMPSPSRIQTEQEDLNFKDSSSNSYGSASITSAVIKYPTESELGRKIVAPVSPVKMPPLSIIETQPASYQNEFLINIPKLLSPQDIIEEQVLDDKVHEKRVYSKSPIYAPSIIPPDVLNQRNSGVSLALEYVHGMNNDQSKIQYAHNSLSNKGSSFHNRKNIFWINPKIIAFPAAAVVVMMNIDPTLQHNVFPQEMFVGHSEEISAMALDRSQQSIASGSGKNGKILLWSYESIVKSLLVPSSPSKINTDAVDHCNKDDNRLEINLGKEFKGVSALSFSGDGNFLLAMASDDSHTLFIFNLTLTPIAEQVNPVVVVKIGHLEVSQVEFNRHLMIPFRTRDDAVAQGKTPSKSQSENNDLVGAGGHRQNIASAVDLNYSDKSIERISGCYTAISCGSKTVKFWSLYKYRERMNEGIIDVSGFKGRRIAMPKRLQQWTTKYQLLGSICPLPKAQNSLLGNDLSFEITCFTVVDESSKTRNKSRLPRAKIFCGTNNGSIIVWQHVEASGSEDANMLLLGAGKQKNSKKNVKLANLQHGNDAGDNLFWLPKGQFLYIITDIHDQSISYMDVFTFDRSNRRSYPASNDCADNEGRLNYLATSAKDGTINLWSISIIDDRQKIPIEFMKSFQTSQTTEIDDHDKLENNKIKNTPMSDGYPTALTFSPTGNEIIICTNGNSIFKINNLLETHSSDVISAVNSTIDLIYRSHGGPVLRVCCHPLMDLYATTSADRTIRIWSVSLKQQLGMVFIKDNIVSSLTFSPDGCQLVAGTQNMGTIIVFDVEYSGLDGTSDDVYVQLSVFVRKKLVSKTKRSNNEPGRNSNRNVKDHGKEVHKPVDPHDAGFVFEGNKAEKAKRHVESKEIEITECVYSPNGSILAVGCRNHNIYLLSVEEQFKRFAVCKGHNSSVLRISFSKDSAVIQSNDVNKELLYWNSSTGTIIPDAKYLRDVEWNTWNSVCGWPVQGIHNRQDGSYSAGDDTVSVCRSHDNNVIAVGTMNMFGSTLKVFQYPSLPNSVPLVYSGHSTLVADIDFTYSDSHLVSVGGAAGDSCVMLWKVTRN